MENKREWLGAWKFLLILCLTAIMELAVIDISQLSPELRWIYLFTGIICLIASFGIVNVLWVLGEKALYRFRTWRQKPNTRNLNLEKDESKQGIVPLILYNNEKRLERIWISRIQVVNDPLTWMPISSTGFFEPGLSIKRGERKEILFLKWNEVHRYFQVADYGNDDYKKVFGVGVHKFDIVLTYGFNKHGNEFVKRFSVAASFEEHGVIRILEIKHAD